MTCLNPSENVTPQPAQERWERWQATVAGSPVPAQVVPFPATTTGGRERHGFHASVEVAALGQLVFAQGRVGPHSKIRTQELINAADQQYYVVQLHLAGACQSATSERQDLLRPGALVLRSGERTFQLCHPTDNQALFVYIPAAAMPFAGEAFARVHGIPASPDSGVACLLRGVLLNLSGQLRCEPRPALPSRLAGTVLDLVDAVLLDQVGRLPADRGRLRQALLVQIQQDIEANLRSDQMSPDDIAARNHISKRTLHKLFEAEQLSVSAWVRERRLQHCARDLREPTLAGVPVAGIAALWGLPDPARFSRAFRSRFGTTPSDYRHHHLAGGPHEDATERR